MVGPVNQVFVTFNSWHFNYYIVKVFQWCDQKERRLVFIINSKVEWEFECLGGCIESRDLTEDTSGTVQKIYLCGKSLGKGLAGRDLVNKHIHHKGQGSICVKGGLEYRYKYSDKQVEITCIVYQNFTGAYTNTLLTAQEGHIPQTQAPLLFLLIVPGQLIRGTTSACIHLCYSIFQCFDLFQIACLPFGVDERGLANGSSLPCGLWLLWVVVGYVALLSTVETESSL